MEQKVDERLQKAAEYYAEHYSSNKDTALSAYIVGAQWQRNFVWHDASEELPVPHRRVLLYTKEGTITQGRHDGGSWVLDMWVPKFPKILKWCYLSDILPSETTKD